MKTKLLILAAVLLIMAEWFSACKEKEPWIWDPEPPFHTIDIESAWSPDGQWIAYSHRNGFGGDDIYLIRPDGTENTLWQAGGVRSTWSPCGEWMAFSRYAQIWKKKLNGDSLTQLTNDAGRHFFTAWSPDGNALAYNQTVGSTNGIWKLDLSTGVHTHIIKWGMYFDFNPVTGQLLYTTAWYGGEINMMGDSVFTYNLSSATKEFIVLLKWPTTSSRDLKCNNTGTKILFSSQSLQSDKHWAPGIWVMNVDGSNIRKLIDNGEYPSWSPDGTKIAYTDDRKENGRLWIMNADGSGRRQLTFDSLFTNKNP